MKTKLYKKSFITKTALDNFSQTFQGKKKTIIECGNSCTRQNATCNAIHYDHDTQVCSMWNLDSKYCSNAGFNSGFLTPAGQTEEQLGLFLGSELFNIPCIPSVLISGGVINGAIIKSVEIYNPVTKTSCSLPKLPQGRWWHTQDGEIACGGGSGSGTTQTTCVKWSSESGTWTQSHTLRQSRFAHVSWSTDDGVYLMGGKDSSSRRTTELVKEDGSVEDGFSLKYDTM